MSYHSKIPCYLCALDDSQGIGSYRCDKCHKKICDDHVVVIGCGRGKNKETYCCKCNCYTFPQCYLCLTIEDEDHMPFGTCEICKKTVCCDCKLRHEMAEHRKPK